MPQLETVKLQVDVTEARRRIRRVLAEAKQANIALAKVEERLGSLVSTLAEYGIRVEVGDDR